MEFICTKSLTTAQKKEIRQLTEICQKHDQITLTFPTDDSTICFLLYEEQRLLSALFLFFSEDSLCECGAFTHPESRKKGYFSQLLQSACSQLEQHEAECGCNTDLYFCVDEHASDTRAVLNALDAEFWYSEYMMSLPLTNPKDEESITVTLASPGTFEFRQSSKLLGTCHIQSDQSNAYFYGFKIAEPLRRQGFGTRCLHKMLHTLWTNGVTTVYLQVSGENAAALALYKKTGFQITETLSYYWY